MTPTHRNSWSRPAASALFLIAVSACANPKTDAGTLGQSDPQLHHSNPSKPVSHPEPAPPEGQDGREPGKAEGISLGSLRDSSAGFPAPPDTLSMAAGNAQKQASARIASANAEMRANFKKNQAAIGDSVYPFLFSDFTPDGGRYTLLINESDWVSAKPVPPLYADLKGISHIPLGIWVIIDTYGQSPKDGPWIEPLEHYGNTLRGIREHLSETNMPPGVEKDSRAVLNAALKFIDQAVTERTFTPDGFTQFSHSIAEQLVRHQALAAHIQVTAFTELLTRWRAMVGEKAWSELYAVVSAEWTLSTENVHELIISKQMNPEQAASNVFVTSRPLAGGLQEARALLGRIVGDRVMAKRVLRTHTQRERENIYSLSTSRDLLSKAAEDALSDLETSAACPHLQASSSPTDGAPRTPAAHAANDENGTP